jgi:aspartyl/asparaginyl-tRNA synthetase
MSIDLIDPLEFDFVSTKYRDFCKSRGLIEVPVQHRLSILAACEDPSTIATFEYIGQVYPEPQTGQMWLEHELLKNHSVNGFFCYSTSYRQEVNPKPGRHNLIFPMFEFEIPGGMDVLQQFEIDFVKSLGYTTYDEGDYIDIAQLYNSRELGHEHEEQLYKDYGSVFFLKNFPFSTSPFWNMRADMETQISNKIDVIINGIETIGSAERSCNPNEMRKMFYEISDGMYAKTLFSKFGKDRVERELEAFLQHDFFERSGGGIGVTRLIRGLKMEGLLF